jgi:hypothetical protein
MDRYHVYSTDDMVNWTDHGEILRAEQVPWGREEGGFMWAPDCAYKNGTYYFYFPHPSGTDWGATWKIGIATSSEPASGFVVQGYIAGLEPMIDPCVFVDDDGKVYFYYGGGGVCKGGKLKDNMTEIDGSLQAMVGLEDFHEAAWVHKRNGIYYLSYSDNNSKGGNRMRYATSSNPLGPWTYQGIYMEPTGSPTNHGSIVEYKGQWYFFYHNSALSGHDWLRSVCVDSLFFNENGSIRVVNQTKQHGTPFKDVPLAIPGVIEAEDFDKGGQGISYSDTDTENNGHEYRLDESVDIENCETGGYNIGWTNGGEWMEYTVDIAETGYYKVKFIAASPNGNAFVHLEVGGKDVTGSVAILTTNGWQSYSANTVDGIRLEQGVQVIRLFLETGGLNLDRIEFEKGASTALNWQLVKSNFPDSEPFVAAYSVKDFGATGDGVTDVTSIFQDRLNALGRLGGGTLFVPAGKYVIRGNLLIPKGITLRGEWKKPVKGQAIEGTVLMAYAGRGDEGAASFITMETSAAVMDLAIWYPEQTPANITPYPPAVTFGRTNYFGNEFCNAKNVTFVNAYTGLVFSRQNGGTCPSIRGLYGTPLSRGVEIDNIVDIGRIEQIDFSPEYWAGSGLEGSPSANGSHKTWIYENGVGVVMRRNDWSYTCYVEIEGYSKGFLAGYSISSPGAIPNGHHYEMTFTDCKTGIYFEGVADVGILFSRINMVNCKTGIEVGPDASGTAQFHTVNINATGDAIKIPASSVPKFTLLKSIVAKGKISLEGGTSSITDCDFNNESPQISLTKASRAVVTGNRFSKGAQITNTSIFASIIDHSPVEVSALPEFPDDYYESPKPAREALYVVTDEPFNAKNDGVTDNTVAIQNALNKAHEDGGGYVFLPPGKYKVLGNLTVPTGVELKGSVDVMTTPTGPGSVLEVYAGKNTPSATPFLKLSDGSGVRGVVFNYPEQMYSLLPNPASYPYCIQGGGSDVYMVNIGIRAAYQGIDLFTNRCDNHYVDFVAGHVFNNGIRVGGGSRNGKISNFQFNVIVYACGAESKFGNWPNSIPQGDDGSYQYAWDNLDFMILGDCRDQLLYNNFHYGSKRGVVFVSENGKRPEGISLGTGVDGARTGMSFSAAGTDGFDFINSQIVAIGDQNTKYIETTSDFDSEIRFFNSDYWGNPVKGFVMNGGSLIFNSANFLHPGQTGLATINEGLLEMTNSVIPTEKSLLNYGAEPRLSMKWSVVDPTGINKNNCAAWIHNLSNSMSVVPGAMLSRNGWRASASDNNRNAYLAIDGSAGTRWDTQGSQCPGQWFSVDFSQKFKIDGILLDVANSAGDSPTTYELYVSNNGTDWTGPVVSGKGTSGLTIINFPTMTVQHIRIKQTGSTGNYWSIHELNVFNSDGTGTGIEFVGSKNAGLTIYPNPASSFVKIAFDAPSVSDVNLEIFDVTGKLVKSYVFGKLSENEVFDLDVSALSPGIYFVGCSSLGSSETKRMIIQKK